ncbi:MAG: DNA polymerase III subunit delta' [Chloroflexi bacterium]|nr:DNA polymerase III subunit delta' [Chloroflexota bacterium]
MWQVAGHEWAVKLLQQSLAANHCAHAYLFIGPPQIGKTTLALELAKALNCTDAERPCGRCLSCTKIAHGVHPDVRIIEAQEGALKIAQVRELQREAILAPFEGKRRVYILPDFQQATPDAANCLLKTLEEPPPSVMLILTATDPGALLPTIISRCQVLALHSLSTQETRQALQATCQADAARIELLARLSEGRVGWAIGACRDEQVLKARERWIDLLARLPEERLMGRMRVAEELGQKPDQVPGALDLWLLWWRDILLSQVGCPELITNIDRADHIAESAPRYQTGEIQRFIQSIQRTKTELDGNANLRLALEVLCMDCPAPRLGLNP